MYHRSAGGGWGHIADRRFSRLVRQAKKIIRNTRFFRSRLYEDVVDTHTYARARRFARKLTRQFPLTKHEYSQLRRAENPDDLVLIHSAQRTVIL